MAMYDATTGPSWCQHVLADGHCPVHGNRVQDDNIVQPRTKRIKGKGRRRRAQQADDTRSSSAGDC